MKEENQDRNMISTWIQALDTYFHELELGIKRRDRRLIHRAFGSKLFQLLYKCRMRGRTKPSEFLTVLERYDLPKKI